MKKNYGSLIHGKWKKGSSYIPNDLELFSCTPDSAVNPWYEYINFDEFFEKNN